MSSNDHKKANPVHSNKNARYLILLPIIFILVLIFVLGNQVTFSVANDAMRPTFQKGDRITVSKISLNLRDPRRGEVIAFKMNNDPKYPKSAYYFLRVIGLPGESTQIQNHQVLINGKPSGWTNSHGALFAHALKDQYYLLGDNTTNSYDSRFFGYVPRSNILGRVWLRTSSDNNMTLVK